MRKFYLIGVLLVMLSNLCLGQIVADGLNNSSSLFTLTGGAYFTGNSGTSDRPATSPFASEGTHAYGISNGTATLTSSNIGTAGYTAIAMQLRVASFSIGSTTNGADAGDIITVEISPNGGTNWYSTSRILGNSNAYWDYSTGTGVATTAYDGNVTPVDFSPAGGGNRTTDGYSTLNITGLPAATNLRVRITILNNSANELWVVDDFRITGTPATYSLTYSGNGNTGGSVPAVTNHTAGSSVTVSSNSGSLTRTCYTFGGWNTQTDGNGTNYIAGTDNITINANTTLYAKWNAAATTITSAAGGGDWDNTATWVGGVVPGSDDNVVINAAVTTSATKTRNSCASTTINSGGTLTFNQQFTNNNGTTIVNAGGALVAGATYVNNGTTTVNGTFQLNGGGYAMGNNFVYAAAGSYLVFNNGGTYGITPGQTFWPASNSPYNVTVNTGSIANLNDGVRTVNGTLLLWGGFENTSGININGTLQLNANGYVSVSSPTYNTGSTLRYNGGGTFNATTEWTIAVNGHQPHHVQVSNNTTLNYANQFGARTVNGDLTIDAGSSFYMDFGGADCGGALTVVGNVTNNGNLSLGNQNASDLKLSGNLVFGAGYNFYPNNRAIYFKKNGTQTITTAAAAALTIPYMVIGEGSTGTTVQLGQDVTISSPLGGFALSFSNAADKLDINGRDLVIGSTNVSKITGPGYFRGSASSKLRLRGNIETGYTDIIRFDAGYQELQTLEIDRIAGLVTARLGSALTINTSLVFTTFGGLLDIATFNLSLGATATTSGANQYAFIVADGTGEVRKTFTGNGLFVFPVGDNSNPDGAQYSPATLQFTAGSFSAAWAGLKLSDNSHAGITNADRISRYWIVTSSGISSPTYHFTGVYTDPDIIGTEANLFGQRWNGTDWLEGAAVTAAANSFVVSGQTDLSATNEFTASGPILPPDPTGTISGTTPACTSTSLSFSGTAPTGVTYYWQTSATGTSTTDNAASALTVTVSGNYFVRARKNSNGRWSTNSVGPYVVVINSVPGSFTAIAASNLDVSSFTANWNASAGATGYYVDVYTYSSSIDLAGWTFPTSGTTLTADIFSANNSGKLISVNTGSGVTSVGGATTQAPSASDWDNGNATKYWQINVDATGYGNMTLSSKQRSSGTGPKDFKVQYKLGSSGTWTDVTGGTVTVADNFTSGVLNNLTLPAVCNNQSDVSIRWIMTSNTNVNNTTVASGGTSRIDDIYVKGSTQTFVPGYQNLYTLNNFLDVTGLASGTTYYYVVRADNGNCTTANSNEIPVTTIACTPAVTISSFAPATGPVGTLVSINGTGFSATPVSNGVKFGEIFSPSYTIVNNSLIIAEVPAGVASTSIIKVRDGLNCWRSSSTNFALIATAGSCTMSDLIISEVYDPASDNNHYIEIFNGTNSTINLNSPNNYTIQLANLPGSTVINFDITGTIAPGQVKVYYAGTNSPLNLATAPAQGVGSGFNADDEIRLLKNGSVIDRMVAPNNTGYNWRRAATVLGPNATYTAAEWTLKEENDGSLSSSNIGTFVAGTNLAFTTHPSDQNCTFNMSIAATGSITAYQWKYYNSATGTWDNVTSGAFPGATIPGSGAGSPTSSTLTISGNIAAFQDYQFYCEIRNAGLCNSASNAAQFKYESRAYYRAKTPIASAGEWTVPASWEMSDDLSTFVATCTYPTAANSSGVIIPNGMGIKITLGQTLDIDRVTIDAGGQFEIVGGSKLDIYNGDGANTPDLIVNGTLIDRGSQGNGLVLNRGTASALDILDGTWNLGANGTIIKTYSSSSTQYGFMYRSLDGASGISSIPATANWIYRRDNTGTAQMTFAASDGNSGPMYYPNLTIENSLTGNTYSSIFDAVTPSLSDFTMLGSQLVTVRGNLDIGGTGTGFINFLNINTNAGLLSVLGNMIVRTGNTLRNDGNASNYGAGVDVKGNLTIDGTFTNNGGTALIGILRFSGTNAQTISGSGTMNLEDVDINNTTGNNVVVNKSFDLPGTLSFGNAAARLQMGTGDITLKSGAARTANVLALPTTGAINYPGAGRFVVERYIGYTRKWQLLSIPTITDQTIRQAWQDNGSDTTTATGYGVQITGPGGANGLDNSSVTASMKYYNPAIDDYVGVTNTNTNIQRDAGYFLYVYGNRTAGAFESGPSPVTTLRTRGKLFNGNGAPETINPVSITNALWASIGNPFASQLNFPLWRNGNAAIENAFSIWDPSWDGNDGYQSGDYQTYSAATGFLATPGSAGVGGSNIYQNSVQYPNIQSGSAFFVLGTGNGSVPFAESQKTDGSQTVNRGPGTNDLVDPATVPMFSSFIFTSAGRMGDGNRVVFDNQYRDELDYNDASKRTNEGISFGMDRGAKWLAVEARSKMKAGDTIHYSMGNILGTNYRLVFAVQNLHNPSLQAELVDRYTQRRYPVSLSDSSFVDITMDNDPASRAYDRFYVVFTRARRVKPSFVSVDATRQANGEVNVRWKVSDEADIVSYTLEHGSKPASMNELVTIDATNSSQYTKNDAYPLAGDNYYRIKATDGTGARLYSDVVKVGGLHTIFSIRVVGNPVTGNKIPLEIRNAAVAGNYQAVLYTEMGQLVHRQQVRVQQGSQLLQLNIPGVLSTGNYKLSIRDDAGTEHVLPVLIVK